MSSALLVASQPEHSAYARILGWPSVAPILLLLALLVELEVLRTRGHRAMTTAVPTLLVLVAPLSLLVVIIAVVRALELVT